MSIDKKFAWTKEFKQTWNDDDNKKIKQVYNSDKKFNNCRKSIIRNLVFIIDMSEAIEKTEYLPTIRSFILPELSDFSDNFVKLNPLSKITFTTFNYKVLNTAFKFDKNLLSSYGTGHFSFTSCLSYINGITDTKITSKECLLIISSVGVINEEINFDKVMKEIIQKKIKINIISICGEVTLLKKVCISTGGKYVVPINGFQFKSILSDFLYPPESLDLKCSLIEVGFPKNIYTQHLCACHLNLCSVLFECPKCKGLVCTIPSTCPICKLELISSIDICDLICYNYHLEPFIKIATSKELSSLEKNKCYGCEKLEVISVCNKCLSPFCYNCDAKLHNVINFCPFCPP